MGSDGDRDRFTTNYWQYYRLLEADCVGLRRFIRFCDQNMSTCSDEIAKQLMSVCAEFDNLCKEITGLEDSPHIHDYYNWFYSDSCDIDLSSVSVSVKYANVLFFPFRDWPTSRHHTMPWWTAYNSIKHGRSLNYTSANLMNLLSALAALYFLECYQFKRISISESTSEAFVLDVPPDLSELFYTKSLETKTEVFGGGLFGVSR